MTIVAPRSDKERKVEPASPETKPIWYVGTTPVYDPDLDGYASWLLAIGELHKRKIAELVADHDNRMPEG
jgi:hypothetical protein